MDLSRLKWPLIIGLVALAVWIVSDPGVDFMRNQYLKGTPGENAEADVTNEAGLSRLGGFLLKTLRYQRAEQVFTDAITLYPNGKNFLYNQYRLAKCKEKTGKTVASIAILRELERMDAHAMDKRVAESSNLKLRADKLMELGELGEIQ